MVDFECNQLTGSSFEFSLGRDPSTYPQLPQLVSFGLDFGFSTEIYSGIGNDHSKWMISELPASTPVGPDEYLYLKLLGVGFILTNKLYCLHWRPK